MTNFVLTIAYDGSRYHGWQRLGGDEMTIQGKLEHVIGEFCGHKVEINGAGTSPLSPPVRQEPPVPPPVVRSVTALWLRRLCCL